MISVCLGVQVARISGGVLGGLAARATNRALGRYYTHILLHCPFKHTSKFHFYRPAR